MRKIDAHAHWAGDTPEAFELLKELKIKVLNIGMGRSDGGSRWGKHGERYGGLAREYPEFYAWCTGIDKPNFDDPDKYVEETIQLLGEDFRNGAIACKVAKNFGMSIKDKAGNYFMVDDDLLKPIFSFIEDQGKPLIMHIGEPMEAFQPLDENGVFYSYYSSHQDYHFYGKEGLPTHKQLMDSRDHVVERHPNLTVVGAHYGSLEYDVDEVAKRFDKYPNFVVDSSGIARADSLSRQDRGKVYDFIVKYQDRIMFGMDRQTSGGKLSELPAEQQKGILNTYREHLLVGMEFYQSSGKLMLRGKERQGLGLPQDVMKKIMYLNAKSCFPGM